MLNFTYFNLFRYTKPIFTREIPPKSSTIVSKSRTDLSSEIIEEEEKDNHADGNVKQEEPEDKNCIEIELSDVSVYHEDDST